MSPSTSPGRPSIPRQTGVRALFAVWSKFYNIPIAQELFYRRIHRLILGQWTPRAGETILDVGCGTGVFLRQLASEHEGLALTGLDLSEEMLRVARKPLENARSPFPEFDQGSVYEMPYESETFDVVLNTISCHFYLEQVRAFQEVHRVLKEDGSFYCAALTSPIPYSVPGMGVWYPARTLRKHLEQAGFKVVRTERMLPNVTIFSCEKDRK